jgi:hypothetical protein
MICYRECECGCGELIADRNKNGPIRFKHGHGKLSVESRKKIGIANSAENNGMWKGDDVGLNSLHEWVEHRLPRPYFCKKCERLGSVDLCNISGKYLRDLTDWEYLCRRCHMLSDGRMNNLVQYSK